MRDTTPAAEGGDAPVPDGARLDITLLGVLPPEQLTHPDARSIAQHVAAGYAPYTQLVECRGSDETAALEIVVLDAEVEVPQHPVHDIQRVERIAVCYRTGVDHPLEVLALRESFPTDVPHLNLRSFEYPRSLCLYDVQFRDVRAQWTPGRFITLIREWLRLTARGELHAEDQPLERMLMDVEGHLILPRAILDAQAGTAVMLTFEQRPDLGHDPVFVGTIPPPGDVAGGPFALVLRLEPRVHGVIQRTPKTLAELHAMLAPGGDNVLGKLRAALKPWVRDEARLRSRFFLVLLVPKQRIADGPAEAVETWAFLPGRTVREIGEAVGLWATTPGGFGPLLWPEEAQDGRDVSLGLASVRYTVGREELAKMNGHETAKERRVALIGGGALGSQVLVNAVRAGEGRWTVIDNDRLLPHNLARHALHQDAVGHPKATSLKQLANRLADDAEVHDAVDADLLAPGEKAEHLRAALTGADLILDCSASVTVARHLARDVEALARRCSLFLNPSGTDLTLLSEDVGRTAPLDALEMQYYRAVATRTELTGALSAAQSRVRYGRSCRDLSVTLPQSLVGLYAGISALAVEFIASAPTAEMRVWRLDPATLGVVAVQVPVEPVRRATVNGWEIVTDDGVLRKLAELRVAKLPRETGGVLVGTYDLPRRVLYVVDVIASPRDSEEHPTSYIRGVAGLADDVERITAATAGQLHYIGEWHSHPAGHRCLPSDKDRKLFAWIAGELAKDSLPGLMVIVGDDGLAVPYLEHLDDGTEYPATLRLGGAAAPPAEAAP